MTKARTTIWDCPVRQVEERKELSSRPWIASTRPPHKQPQPCKHAPLPSPRRNSSDSCFAFAALDQLMRKAREVRLCPSSGSRLKQICASGRSRPKPSCSTTNRRSVFFHNDSECSLAESQHLLARADSKPEISFWFVASGCALGRGAH